MLADKLKVLKAYIKKIINKDFIRASFSLTASPVLFTKKLRKSLHFYVDYQ